MSRMKAIAVVFLAALMVSAAPLDGQAQDRASKAIKKFDRDGDGRVSRAEWKRSSAAFDEIDTDDDGVLTGDEFRARFGETEAAPRTAPDAGPKGDATAGAKKAAPEGGDGDLVDVKSLSPETKGAFTGKFRKREHEVARGLFESTLIPVYPADATCPRIDHVFGEPWKGPVANRFHAGADIPASWNEPILAMADGEVVAKFKGERGYRGRQVVLRHAPQDTGLPVWIYTLYSHFNTMPKVEVGQRVRMGQVLGPNGKSGVPGRHREPHLHLTVSFSDSGKYARTRGLLIAVQGRHMDPVALFRGRAPLDTEAMTKLPEAERQVVIAFKRTSGEVVPPGARVIWPFACAPK